MRNLGLTSSSQQDEELYLLNQFVDIFEVNASRSQELLNSVGPENLLIRLKAFENSKIDFVLIMIMGMLQCDGSLNQEEVNFMVTVLDRLDISLEDFTKKMEMNKKMYDFFMK